MCPIFHDVKPLWPNIFMKESYRIIEVVHEPQTNAQPVIMRYKSHELISTKK